MTNVDSRESVLGIKKRRFDPVAQSKTFNNILKEFNLNDKLVLDIGCSYGEFLTHFGDGSIGLTLSIEEVTVAKEMGLDVRLLNIEEDNLGKDFEGKFDVIFANNIFEHLQSPHNFLLKIKTYLKPNGLLILGVPCLPRPLWLTNFKKFRGSLASLHINFFTRDTLIKTLEFSGWKVWQARGFHFRNKFIDALLNQIYPHIYVCAHINDTFKESNKRLNELKGYKS